MAKFQFNPATGELDVIAGENPCTASNASGTPIIYTEADTFTDTTETEILVYTASNADSKIIRFLGEADTFGLYKVYKGAISPANLQFRFRTSEMNNNLDVLLYQPIVLADTEVLRITFQAIRYRTKHLGASGDTFIRIEGSY